MTDVHDFDPEQDFVTSEIVAGCSCGWEQHRKKFSTTSDAIDEWENHCDAVFMEATTRGPEW